MLTRQKERLITLREYERLYYEHLESSVVDRLESLTNSLGVPMFRFFRNYAQARQYVGVVRVGDVTFQILPKVFDKEEDDLGLLVHLLSYTEQLRLSETGSADQRELSGSFLEIWIRHFARELNRLLRTRPQQRYVEVEERVGFLRGKLLPERELSGKSELDARYACRYEIFTPDHLLNRVLKFCNRILLKETGSAKNRAVLRENDALMSDVELKPVKTGDLRGIHLDRLNRRYEPILELCRLLLSGATLDLNRGSIKQLAFVFDMNRLFEEFVYRFLKRQVGRLRVGRGGTLAKVEYQLRIGSLFDEFGMVPDLLLTDDAGSRILVDTKYKSLSAQDAHRGLSQSDFYQMYSYGRAGSRNYDDIVLLYPTLGVSGEALLEHGDLRVHVRQIDLKTIYEAGSGYSQENAGHNAIVLCKSTP